MNSDQTGLTCSAPGRAGIIGNPTDMYGGAVLSCSVGMRARVQITPAPAVTLASAGHEIVLKSAADLHPRGDRFDIARAVIDYLHWLRQDEPAVPPCRVSYTSEIPLRSGLAGSTALVVALLQGLLAWQGKREGRYRLAERARYIELNNLKVVCGYQDAYMCTFGGLNYMDFRGKQFYRDAEAELFATIEPLAGDVEQLPFLLATTGVRHVSGEVHRPIRERWLDGEADVVRGYERITELARLGKKALLNKNWLELGRLMNENHAIQRGLGGSGETNEQLISAALQAGALGAKLAGAGNGGTIIALWPGEEPTCLEEALRDAGATSTYTLKCAPGVQVETVPSIMEA